MNTQPLNLPPAQRALLQEFERLHEEWRVASEAADALECKGHCCSERQGVAQLLEYRLAADRVHQRAMRLLREAPI
jgi:hypothetical protein